ncbi:hypothetical protein BU15DRAFT_82946 [Melanogaster broomeanus]|nr:hypothetical protein BU15DRAFT_82946 [Melanogaster broomeanus]
MREKCEWPEMHAPGAGKGMGKGREAKVQDDNEVEIVRESRSGVGPSWISLDRLVMAIEEMSDRLGELVQAQRELTQASRKARRALEAFVDEAVICGVPEEFCEESTDKEEVDEQELDEDLAGLDEELVENPMSPPKNRVQESGGK